MHWRPSFLVLSAVLGTVAMASCSSVEPAPGGVRIESAEKRPQAPLSSPNPRANPGQGRSPSSSVGPLSPLDWTIRDDCPPRPWSKNVPDQACTKDSECGDGFCDRDHCAAIWTCDEHHGQRCYGLRSERSGLCYGLCIEGRCRSCLSDDECAAVIGGGGTCNGLGKSGAHGCGITFDRAFNISPGRIPPDAGDDP
jgi:hypothetical protein